MSGNCSWAPLGHVYRLQWSRESKWPSATLFIRSQKTSSWSCSWVVFRVTKNSSDHWNTPTRERIMKILRSDFNLNLAITHLFPWCLLWSNHQRFSVASPRQAPHVDDRWKPMVKNSLLWCLSGAHTVLEYSIDGKTFLFQQQELQGVIEKVQWPHRRMLWPPFEISHAA